jgi:hypothetical protein
MVGKRSPFTDQMQSCIKNCCIPAIQSNDIFNEMSRVTTKQLSAFATNIHLCSLIRIHAVRYQFLVIGLVSEQHGGYALNISSGNHIPCFNRSPGVKRVF